MRFHRAVAAALAAATLQCSAPPPPAPDAPSADPLPEGVRAPSDVATAASAASASASAASSARANEYFVPERVTYEEGAMGTRVVLVAYTDPKHDVPAIKAAILDAFGEIQRLEKLMSTWVPDSEVSRINDAAGKDAIAVGPETFAVIDESLWISRESGGVFDITFEAMHGLWKFDEGHEDRIPPKDAILKAKKLIDYRQVELDARAHTVKIKKPGMRINLGGIAKGFAVDAASKKLEAHGLDSYFVQAGGDLFVRGKKPDGSRYRVGIRDPRGKGDGDYFAIMEVEDHAFSTAGDYERAFVKNGKRYHHIIDPRSGYPATASRSVTVWAPNAFVADAIDDAVFILGPKDGAALAEKIDGVGVVVVDKDNKVTISKNLAGLVQKTREPTDAP
ncbi:MAG TPA: FAD:protein FMN transferase [Polyangiaceae bacterium]|jgi:thiamine biosynthesis lipoprotein|nr:FAD:protein FMN transferase [Polyangiaceae bacterium]